MGKMSHNERVQEKGTKETHPEKAKKKEREIVTEPMNIVVFHKKKIIK
jgi:hypothetical protein